MNVASNVVDSATNWQTSNSPFYEWNISPSRTESKF